jgi:cell division protein FtsI/penicillin-binding protein 2
MTDSFRPRRRRGGRLLWPVLAGLLVVVVVGGWLAIRAFDSGPEGPHDTVAALLGGWHRGDVQTVARLTAAPAGEVIPTYRDQADDLGGWPTQVRLVRIRESGDRATAIYRTTFRAAERATWTYRGRIELTRTNRGWRARWRPANVHPLLTGNERFHLDRAWQPRAPILAEDGRPLTVEGAVVTVGIEPRRMTSRADTLAALQRYLGVDPAVAGRALDAPGVQPDYFVAVATVPDAQYQAVKPQIYPIPGLLFRRSTERVPATPQLGAHVVGTTGPITKDLLEQLGPPYGPNDRVGRNGLERVYERRLAGTPTVRIQLVGPDGAVTQQLHTIAGTPPQPVRTTLDLPTQQRAEAALGTTAPAALVAVRPSDGAVRAVVSTPVTDEFDRAVDGAYPPGSTFKVVTSAALLGNGVTLDTVATCPPTLTVNGRAFRNFEGETEASLSFLRAFAISCNTAFIGLAQKLPPDALAAAATAFGFGPQPDLGVASRPGSFPPPTDATERAAAAIGQARVTASPVVMAGVAGTVAAGQWHAPRLVLEPAPPAAPVVPPVAPDVIASLRTAMAEVVADGTGTAAAVSGQAVAGKTGTAEFGTDTPPQTHAWFIGFRGDLAFAVVVEGGGVGGRVAAPIAHTFLAAG